MDRPVNADTATCPTSLNLDRYLAVAGSAAASFARLWQRLWLQPYVSAELLEMCRLTLARLHRDTLEFAAHNPHLPAGILSPERRAIVLAGDSQRSPHFSPREKAVLLFCECYGLDAQSIGDDVAEQAKSHLGEAGLVFLIEALGCLDGRIRTARCLRDLAAAAGESHGN
jgi:hypothetical protein